MTRRADIAILATLLVAPLFAAQVPRQAPELVINLPDGGQKLLSSYRGKVVLIEFLFTTCPHCQDASRMMSRLQKEYGPKGFQALGVAFNPMSKMLVPDFVRTYGVTYPVGFAEREPVAVFLQVPAHEALHVPQMVFIDRKGVIRKQSLPRGDGTTAQEGNVRAMIQQLLAEPVSSSGPGKRNPTKKSTS